MKYLLTTLLLTSIYLCKAQGFIDLLSFDYYRGLNEGNYDDYNTLNLTLQAPIPLKNQDVILSGFVLEQAAIDYRNTSFTAKNLTFNAGYQRQLNNGKSLLVLSIHRFNSDEFRLVSENYQFGFVGLYTYKKTDNATFQIGFYTNQEFMGTIATPLFGIDWKISPRVRFYGVLPATGTIAIKNNEKWYYGLTFLGIFQTYQQPELGDFYIQRSINQASLYSEYYLTKQIVLNIKLGYRVGSAYRLFRTGDEVDWALNVLKFGDNREEIDFISSDQFIFTAGLRFRFGLEN